MSSGFEVRSLTMDRNPLKKLKTQEEEVFTIQVGLFCPLRLRCLFDGEGKELSAYRVLSVLGRASPWGLVRDH